MSKEEILDQVERDIEKIFGRCGGDYLFNPRNDEGDMIVHFPRAIRNDYRFHLLRIYLEDKYKDRLLIVRLLPSQEPSVWVDWDKELLYKIEMDKRKSGKTVLL